MALNTQRESKSQTGRRPYRGNELARDVQAGRYFMTLTNRRIKQNLAALWDHDDEMTTQAANAWLGK